MHARRADAPMSSRLSWLALILLLVPLLAVARPQPAAAAGVVNQCTDTALRTALAGGGLVTFGCSGTVPLTSRLEITQDTTIDGGSVVTLDGQGVTQLLHVAAGAALTLRGLTLTNALSDLELGGAILNEGALMIEASTLSGNRSGFLGGAIFNNGSLTISFSRLTANAAPSGWGGAIYNEGGEVAISHSTLDGNVANGFGGAIYNSFDGRLAIVASTLSGNSANIAGGAIATSSTSTVTIIAGTLSGNSGFRGGAIYNLGNLTVTTSTLSGNSGVVGTAIFNFDGAGGIATLTANVVSGGNGLCGGVVTSNGYNVGSDASCNLTALGDLPNADPLLGQLVNNGGPTETHMPLAGSPALDRVPNALCATLSVATDHQDQRGAPRPEGSNPCDSGSVEVQVNSFFCVGERSGSLRYVSVPNGCVRGEFRLMPTVEGVYAFCVGDRSGSMRYLMSSGASCLRGETKLLLSQVDPITICVGERSRTVRYVADAAACLQGELAYRILNPAG